MQDLCVPVCVCVCVCVCAPVPVHVCNLTIARPGNAVRAFRALLSALHGAARVCQPPLAFFKSSFQRSRRAVRLVSRALRVLRARTRRVELPKGVGGALVGFRGALFCFIAPPL